MYLAALCFSPLLLGWSHVNVMVMYWGKGSVPKSYYSFPCLKHRISFSEPHHENLLGMPEVKLVKVCGAIKTAPSVVFNSQARPHWASRNLLITVYVFLLPVLALMASVPYKLWSSVFTCLSSFGGSDLPWKKNPLF